MQHLSQIELFVGISRLLEDMGVATLNQRQLNALIEAAELICKSHIPAAKSSGIKGWLASDETGLSSCFMASILWPLAKGDTKYNVPSYSNYHPVDPSDFGRCAGLLEAVPELRAHLATMASHGRYWAALIARWDEMETLYAEEKPSGRAPKLSALMRSVLDPLNS